MLQTLKEWDRELFIWLNSLGIERFDGFWVFVTQIETWLPLFIFFFGIIFYYQGFKKGLLVILFTIITFVVTITFTNLVKDYVARLRPNNVEELSTLIRILQKPTNYSFFSGHASSSFAVTTFVVLTIRKYSKWIFLAYLWPFIFIMSRIYVGVHYPSDLFVGALVGTIIAIVFYYILKKIIKKIPN
ncbi:phosphatase PAP2 family protein [Marinirhabdus gelatinilytica]|uniref:Undecaprenyl-diphosphatase n=1 Tax=Marinirhabdus gelatinilytica TaxID=1703343 RepID=A0A370Q8L2_9FLAO|nr:phosphatase PAP2 family protein [Marinirhabdus gelatinilytica]RDK84649.1 undecaprenyl-diphosphatase [Marinirhabdus gelatinilytica]